MTKVDLFGDSVFAGQGLEPQDRPDRRLAQASGVEVSTLAAPDRTTKDGLALVSRVAGDMALVEFGLNDAIEGVPVAETERTLETIAGALKRRGIIVVIVETRVPSSSRWPAVTDHRGLAQRVADAAGVLWVPDILALAAPHLQPDGLHPDAEGVKRIAPVLASAVSTAMNSAS